MPQLGLRLVVPGQFSLQLAATLANFRSLLFSLASTLGFLVQRFGQALELLFHLGLRRLQLLSACLQLGLFGAGTLLLSPELFPRRCQLLPQLGLRLLVPGQFSLQFAATLTNLTRHLLGPCPTLGLFCQGLGQLLELLFHLGLCGLQFLDPGFKSGLFGAGVLLLCLELLLRSFQLLPQLGLHLLVPGQFSL